MTDHHSDTDSQRAEAKQADDLKCGRCGCPIHRDDTREYRGTHVSHTPDRCAQLLHLRIEALEQEYHDLNNEVYDMEYQRDRPLPPPPGSDTAQQDGTVRVPVEPTEAERKAVAEELHQTDPTKPPGPADPPLFAKGFTGPLWEADRAKYLGWADRILKAHRAAASAGEEDRGG